MREVLRTRLLSSGTFLPTALGRTVMRRVADRPESVFLTFDDGPGDGTQRLIDYLHEASIPATFFLTGYRASEHPDLVRIVDNHHQIGNHFFDHRDPWLMRSSTMNESVKKTDAAIQHITGKKPTLMRPPFGHITFSLVRNAKRMKKRICLWDLMPGDFHKEFDPIQSATTCRHMVKGGSLIVLHDHGISHTEERLIPFLETLRSAMADDGFRFDTI